MLKHFKELCNLCGTSGDEGVVREYILGVLKETREVTWKVDPLGNVLVQKTGALRAPRRLMVSAHMDEVGFLITHVFSDGTLAFAPVGGIDPMAVLGRQVLVGKEKRPGVIGSKAVHLLSPEERKALPKFRDLTLDIGAKDAEEAQKIAPPGTFAYFMPDFRAFGGGRVCSKAIDDRAGCAQILSLLEKDAPYDYAAAFVVQEEIGLRGARTAAYTLQPDMALVLESTTAADIAGAGEGEKVCALGKGPVISFMDRATIYDPELVKLAFAVGEKHNISCQPKTRVAGANDAGVIHLSRAGVRTLAVSHPCRYLHSPGSVADLADLDAMSEYVPALTTAMLELPK